MSEEGLSSPGLSDAESDIAKSDPFKISTHGAAYTPDTEECDRLKWHHDAMRLCLQGLYPCPETVEAVLSPSAGETKRILDLGCGSRVWCIEMARAFPHAEIWGTDRHAVRKIWTGDVPANCHFETFDDYDFLTKHENTFDLIHMRFTAGGCTQFNKTMEHIQMCLKPGGLFILIDSTGDLLEEDGITVHQMKTHTSPSGSRLQRMFYEVRHANRALGFDELMMRATLQGGIWDFSHLVDCHAAELLMPIGPWFESSDAAEEKRIKAAGQLLQKSLRTVQSSHEVVLKGMGVRGSELSQWMEEIDAELQNDEKRWFLDVRILWGQRPSGGIRSSSKFVSGVQNYQKPIDKEQCSDLEVPGDVTEDRATPTYRHYRTFYDEQTWYRVTEQRFNHAGRDPQPLAHRLARSKPRPLRFVSTRKHSPPTPCVS